MAALKKPSVSFAGGYTLFITLKKQSGFSNHSASTGALLRDGKLPNFE